MVGTIKHSKIKDKLLSPLSSKIEKLIYNEKTKLIKPFNLDITTI